MKAVFVEEKTIDSMYFKLLSEIYDHGRINKIDSGSFKGSKRLEFDYVSGVIQYPTTRPLAPIMPEGLPSITTDKDIESYFINYLMSSNLEKGEHYKYATFISGGAYKIPFLKMANHEGERTLGDWVIVPNQVQWCIDHYKTKGFGNNHCCIKIGYPESSLAYDIPYKHETERGTSPCLQLIDTSIVKKSESNYLNFHVVFRSWDLWGAFPVNIGGFTMLMEYMSNELEVKVGSLSFSSLKLHIYDFQLDVVRKRLGK